MQSPSVPALLIKRTFKASPERVYQAWTDPQLAREFMCPSEVTVGEMSMDVRPGGAFRIEMIRPEGEPFVARGVYREVVPGRRLSMTWTWEEDTPEEEHETFLIVDFAPDAGGTELTLTHENLRNMESLEGHTHGWNSMLDKFEKL